MEGIYTIYLILLTEKIKQVFECIVGLLKWENNRLKTISKLDMLIITPWIYHDMSSCVLSVPPFPFGNKIDIQTSIHC